MSTIEKLFVQIFDRKRQIIEQLNHKKHLYDQHLASKLLIQGITPPPWLLNSEHFASSTAASSSDPKDLNKEELISGLLLPCPQPLPTYSNANHLYGQPLSTVANSVLQHDLFHATSAGCRDSYDCRPGVLPQCLFRGPEDLHHHVAESPQERVVSDIYADPVQSLARMQRSKSRQKALELRSNRKTSVKSQLEDSPPTGPGRQSMLKDGSATASAIILSSSKDEPLLKKQDISSKEEGDSRCLTNEADASTNTLSPHSDCRYLSIEESLVAADTVSSQGGISRHLFKEPDVGIDGSGHIKCETSKMLTDKLIENPSLSYKEEIAGPAEVANNSFEVHGVHQEESPADVATTHGLSNEIAGQVVNLCAQNISNKEEGNSRCLTSEADASTISLSPHSDCHDLPVEESLVAADSVSGKVGTSRHLFKEPVVGIDGSGHRKCANSNILTEELMESPSFSYKEEIAGPAEVATNSFEVHRVQEGEGPAEVATTHGFSNDIAGQVANLCAQEHRSQLQVEQPSSVSSDKMKLVISSTGKKNLRKGERYSGEGELGTNSSDKNKTDIEQSPAEVMSPEEHIRRLLLEQPAEIAYSGEGELSINSSDKNKIHIEKNPAEVASAHGMPSVEVDSMSPEEHIRQLLTEQPASVPSETMTGAISFSGKINLQGDQDLGNVSLDTDSPGQLKTPAAQSLVEAASAQVLSPVISGQSKDLSPEEDFPHLEVEEPKSLSLKRLTHATVSSGEHKVLGESPAERALVDNLLHIVGGQALQLSTTKLTHELDLDHFVGEYSGTNNRESQGRCEASINECDTDVRFSPCRKIAEWSGATANKLATSNSEDKMKFASVKQMDDGQSHTAELQATYFSKEVKLSVPPKLLELQTLWTESSPTSAVGGSWPQQKRRKIESVTSKSAGPNLQVNLKNILSHGVYFGQSCPGDFSATEITQNGLSSLSMLKEHCSTMQHTEEKLSSQGSSYVQPERLQLSSLSSLTQQLIAMSQDSLQKDDLTREESDFSFSIRKVDADPADNKIWCGRNSLELNNALDCSGGSPFMEHKEAVGVEGDIPDLESFIFDKIWDNSQNIKNTDVNMADKVDDNMADILKTSSTACCLQNSTQKVKDFDCLGGSPMAHMDLVGRRASVADLENFTFKRRCDDTKDTGDLESLIAIDLPKNTIDRAKFLERLCRSASLGVPLSHFQASYSSDRKMDVCHSAPTGVLEHTDLIKASAVNETDGQLLTTSHTCTKPVENSEFRGNSFYDHSPIRGTQFAWDFRGPYISPVSKEIDGVSAKSRCSSNRVSSNPELTCFRIEESGEEDDNAEDNDHNCPEETGSLRKSLCSDSEEYTNVVALDPTTKTVSSGSVSTESSISASDKQRSSNPGFTCFPVEESSGRHVNVAVAQTCEEKSRSARQPLRAISKNAAALVLHPSLKRGTESFSRASRTSETNNKISLSSQAQSHQSACLKKRKKDQDVSLGTAGVKKLYESRNTRFSKSNVSSKSGLETRGGSFSEKETKPNNIVSNMTSFVALVQQKQAAARPPVKKDRVKALEAAEALKQREEKEQIERKQKKEAQKLEQEKRKKEKSMQLELKKKAEEEERKRKDAEIAERKRKREEDERKEKERKRKRVGEARRPQKGYENKMSVDKEECRSQAEDGKTDGRKEVNAGIEETAVGGQEVKKAATKPANNPATSSVLPIPSGYLYMNEDSSVNVAGCSTPTPDVNYTSTTQKIREKSYDISPYCCSDGEEEEEDESPNDKFIPAWASKSSVTKALASFNTLDPDVIFPPSSFCSLNEVLLPRQLKQR